MNPRCPSLAGPFHLANTCTCCLPHAGEQADAPFGVSTCITDCMFNARRSSQEWQEERSRRRVPGGQLVNRGRQRAVGELAHALGIMLWCFSQWTMTWKPDATLRDMKTNRRKCERAKLRK